MKFAHLYYLWLLWLVPFLAGFYVFAWKRKRKAMETFISAALLPQHLISVSTGKQKLKPLLVLLAVFFIILALVEPQWGYHWEEIKRKGIDIIVALDVSKSMLAEDIKPNRLERAKHEIKALISMLQGDRIGLVAFAGTAFLQCPLTLDYGTAKLFLDDITIESIPRGGTDLGKAIDKAIDSFEDREKKHRVLILITDGEDHGRRTTEVVERAQKERVVIYTIGVGRQEGAPIPVLDEEGRKGFVKDRQGQVVLSKPDSVLLQTIALKTGGKKGSLIASRLPLEKIYEDEINKLEKKELESTRRKRYESRFQWPLALALLCLVLEGMIGERKKS